MSKEDFMTRDKMEIKRCVACLMRLLIPMKVRGISYLKISISRDNTLILSNSEKEKMSQYTYQILLVAANKCIPKLIEDCLPFHPKTILISYGGCKVLNESINQESEVYNISIPGGFIREGEYLCIQDEHPLFKYFYKACYHLIQLAQTNNRNILIDATKEGVYSFNSFSGAKEEVKTIQSNEFIEGRRFNNPLYSAFSLDLPNIVKLDDNVMGLHILNCGDVHNIKFSYANEGDLIQFY